ncbi:hypothetical protein [Rickettsiella massiliensis]|uniref:hypothetical protein n=1 Tax=Rickettsiella massiliensis TaxID=676517 RepID=UPI00178C3508|nr:hypothetical protein [Rickettsiella massiliensis]
MLRRGENVTPLLSIQKVGEPWFEWFESHSYEHAAGKERKKLDFRLRGFAPNYLFINGK